MNVDGALAGAEKWLRALARDDPHARWNEIYAARLVDELDGTRALLAAQMQITQHLHELRRAEAAELERLLAAIEQARRWHTPDARMGHDDVRCSSCQEESWPCLTARALGADR